MTLVCHDKENKIFENGNEWVWESPSETSKMKKTENEYFPLFAVKRWNYGVDNKKLIDNLEKKYKKSLSF